MVKVKEFSISLIVWEHLDKCDFVYPSYLALCNRATFPFYAHSLSSKSEAERPDAIGTLEPNSPGLPHDRESITIDCSKMLSYVRFVLLGTVEVGWGLDDDDRSIQRDRTLQRPLPSVSNELRRAAIPDLASLITGDRFAVVVPCRAIPGVSECLLGLQRELESSVASRCHRSAVEICGSS